MSAPENPRLKEPSASELLETPMRPFSKSLPMALFLAREAVMRGFRAQLREYDLSEQQWRVIRALMDSDGLEITALARKTLILNASLTRILRNLEGRKLIARHRHNEDQRFVFITLTDRGKSLFREIAPNSEAEYAKIERRFGKERLEQLYALLDKLCADLNRD
jgi:homoprotocatechuate degradation regulator HpaR